MAYPPSPVKKQYGEWFPDISVRGVPTPSGDQTVSNSPVALQTEDDSSSSTGTHETLSAPKRIEFGALRLWASGAGKDSTSYDDGPDFDYESHDIEFGTDDDVEHFCFAPGVDEGDVTVRWHVHGYNEIKSAKLELFCRGKTDAPIWKHHWGGAWGAEDEAIDAFPKNDQLSGPHTTFGEYAFSNVKADTSVKLKAPDGTEITAFPKGLLTVARSPYQLRLTVSGCTAENTPEDGDKYSYPMTAWTYLHVLVDRIEYRFGKQEWLSDSRDDIHEDFKEQVLGKRSESDYGLEGAALAELRKHVEREASGVKTEVMDGKTRHMIPVTVNHNPKRTRVVNEGKPAVEDYEAYEKMWGLGPRVPLVAKPLIRTLSGGNTDTSLADVLVGARLLWDWQEEADTRYEGATRTPRHHGGGDLTREFLAKVHEGPKVNFAPFGSNNCPRNLGGKLGDEETNPVFPKQDPKGDGNGSLPYEVKTCGERTWAASSAFDDTGETGVMFWPARQAGDLYQLKTYLQTDPDHDTAEDLSELGLCVGSPGIFEVYRKVDVYHLVVGSLGSGVNVSQIVSEAVTNARTQAHLMINVVTDVIEAKAYRDLMGKAIQNLAKSPLALGDYPFMGLELPRILKTTGGPGDAFMRVALHGNFQAKVRRAFRDGKMRLIKVDTTKPHTLSESVAVGEKKGAPVYLGGRTPDGDDVAYLLADPGCDAFTNGETVTGDGTEEQWALEFASDALSCWDARITHTVDSNHYGKKVLVKWPDDTETEIEFKRAWNHKHVATALSDEQKTTLKDALVAAATAFADGRLFKVALEGDGSTDRGRTRIEAIKSHLDDLIDNQRLILKRQDAFEDYQARSALWRLREKVAEKGYGNRLTSPKALYYALMEGFAVAYAEVNEITAGHILVHSGRVSDFTSADSRIAGKWHPRKDAWVDFVDYPTGGAADGALGKEGWEDLSLTYLITPHEDWPSFISGYSGRLKEPMAIFLHELGHGMTIDHAPLAPGREGQPKPPSGSKPAEHLKDETCLMNYDSLSNQFCGLCMLRLRGWDYREMGNASERKTAVSFEVGDMDLAFRELASTKRGRMERLQVLGLFNRPLDLGEDEHFKAEFDECWAYSEKLAARLLPGYDTKPEETLLEALQDYCFEGGALPKEDEQSKLRVWGHLHPYYANMDLGMRYGDPSVKDSKENGFKIGAIRGDLFATYQSMNPAIGSYPIEVRVTDEFGFPRPGVKVYVELITPKPIAGTYDPNAAGTKIAGAMSYVSGVAAAPMHTKVAEFFTTFVKPHSPATEGDPQKDNAHADMGGKRGLNDTGDVSTRRSEDGFRNIFTSCIGSHADVTFTPTEGVTSFVLEPYQPKHPGTGELMKHTIVLTTDEFGTATVLFTPSTIAGDTYRLCAYVLDSTDPSERIAEAETGELVVWRTFRVGGYWQKPNASSSSSLSPFQRFQRERAIWSGTPDESVFRKLTAFDLRKSVGDELARGYGEVLFEDGSLTPKPLDRGYWRRVLTWIKKLDDRYSDLRRGALVFSSEGFPIELRPSPDDAKIWTGRLDAEAARGGVAITFGSHHDFDVSKCFAHDFEETLSEDATGGTFKALKATEFVYGMTEERAGVFSSVFEFKGKATGIDETASTVDYGTGAVKIVFNADPASEFSAKKDQDYGHQILAADDKLTVTGATLDNTWGGFLMIRIEPHPRKRNRWTVRLYKDADHHVPENLVAECSDARQGRALTASAANESGLNFAFELGSEGKDFIRTVFYDTGVPRVFARYLPKNPVDPTALVEVADKSPFLLDLLNAEEYNHRRGSAFPKAQPERYSLGGKYTPFEAVTGAKKDMGYGETIFMRSLTAALHDDQGFCYYPGQLFIQANYLNPVLGTGLGGKGTGNTALLFSQGKTSATNAHYLALHEVGHCLYTAHAYNEGGLSNCQHDGSLGLDHYCIMGKKEDRNLMQFCGKCVAALRGLLIMEEPLWKAGIPTPYPPGHADIGRIDGVLTKLTRDTAGSADPAGDSKGIRKAIVYGGTRPLTIAPTVEDPHVLPEVEPDTTPVVVDVEDLVTKEATLEFYPQEKSNWCWAAASQMMRKKFGDETITQCKLAGDALFDDGTDCCSETNDVKCNERHALVLIGLNSVGSGQNQELSWAKIKEEIDADRPFIFAKLEHYYVGYGYEEGTTVKDLLYYDPLPVGAGAKKTMTYEEYKDYIHGGGENFTDFAKKPSTD